MTPGAEVRRPRPTPNHLLIWCVAIGIAAITVWLAWRTLYGRHLDGLGLPAESVELLKRHPIAILSIEGAMLAGVMALLFYWRRTFVRLPPAVPSDLRDEDVHRYVPMAWITKNRIAFGDAFFADDGLYLVAYGDESAAEAAASKMGATGGSMMGGAVLRERAEARQRVIDTARRSHRGQALGDRVMSSVGSARFARDEVMSFAYGKWIGSKLLTSRGLIIVQHVDRDDAAALQQWIESKPK